MTFPVEAKVCLHCGGPLGKPALSFGGNAGPALGDDAPFDPHAEAEDASAPRAGLRLGMGGMWVVLAVIVTIMRACGGG